MLLLDKARFSTKLKRGRVANLRIPKLLPVKFMYFTHTDSLLMQNPLQFVLFLLQLPAYSRQ